MNTKKLSLAAAAAFLVIGLGSCSKSDSGSSDPVNDLNKVKTAKFTITVKDALKSEYDRPQFTFSSGSSGSSSTLWKVNGETRSNETVFMLTEDDFAKAGTYVVELIQPVVAISASVSCINFDAPYTFSYKAEINGKVVKDIVNQSVVEGESFIATYSYTE